MPIRLDVKKKMQQRSDRVKSVEMHPTEPWVLCALYSGKVVIYNHVTGTVFKSFDVSDQPVRCARFIVRKQWIIAGADDMVVRVFNYNTSERVAQFEGHADYIRFLEVHPSQPYVLSSSDDMTVKLWDWEKGWSCVQTFEGHAHYVMMAKINPKDTNTFATASLDRSVKVWSLGAPTPNYSLEGHERGVNCLDYYPGGDRPYIVSGADDFTLKLWDYQTRSCVATLEGHGNNVCAVAFHPRLPLIISGSEDATVRVWSSTTYRAESTLSYGFERAWAVATSSSSNKVALGFDDGTIVIKLGKESPVASMDKNGKIILARNNVIYSASVRSASAFDDGLDGGLGGAPAAAGAAVGGAGAGAAPAAAAAPADGEPMNVAERELASAEIFPVSVQHNSNGRFVAVIGDGEFVIYTAQALRNKTYGPALDFGWSTAAGGSNDYAVRESTSRVKVFKNFKEVAAFRPPVTAEGVHGGALLGVRSADTLIFYDWDTAGAVGADVPPRVARKIEVAAKGVFWSDSGDLVAIAGEDSFFVLRFNREAYAAALAAAAPGSADAAVLAEEGVEAAFELQHAVEERVRNGVWVGDCFVYTSGASRLNYYVGGEVITLSHLDRPLYLLGYLPREGRVFCMDKTGGIVSYALQLALLEYQTAVVRRDFGAANRILAEIPREHYNKIARFLDAQGFKAEALAVADDPDLKFELAVQLGRLDTAHDLLKAASAPPAVGPGSAAAAAAADTDSADAAAKWQTLMDLALAKSNLSLAEECALAARDVSALMLLYSSTGNADGMARLVGLAKEAGRANVAFAALHMLGRVEEASALLADTGRIAEAVFYARTYCPSRVAALMPLWRADVAKHSKRAADALLDPATSPADFPNWDVALQAESIVRRRRAAGPLPPAASFPAARADLDVDVLAVVRQMMESGALGGAGAGAGAGAAHEVPVAHAAAPEPVAPAAAVAAAAPVAHAHVEPAPAPAPAPAPVRPETPPAAVSAAVPEPVAVSPVPAPAPAPVAAAVASPAPVAPAAAVAAAVTLPGPSPRLAMAPSMYAHEPEGQPEGPSHGEEDEFVDAAEAASEHDDIGAIGASHAAAARPVAAQSVGGAAAAAAAHVPVAPAALHAVPAAAASPPKAAVAAVPAPVPAPAPVAAPAPAPAAVKAAAAPAAPAVDDFDFDDSEWT